ncbi:MAG: aminodeoxychorismate synthase component I [Candidatus Omnitrophica bacterium]|nr:aminodeoxychorismate synthase component I [Candidatus Omnitrophota bacterium]
MAYYTCKSYNLKVGSLQLFEALRSEKNCFFLDSSLNSKLGGRYSFLGIDPFYVLKTKGVNPFPILREALEKYKISVPENMPPFLGGAVGYLAYDLGFLLEKKLSKSIPDTAGIPDCYFAFYNTAVIIDNIKRRLYISALGFPEKSSHFGKPLCELNSKKIVNLLSRISPPKIINQEAKSKAGPAGLKSNFTRKNYLLAVDKAKKYIRDGDIYQVNLSQRFEAKTTRSSSGIYRQLRRLSPSNFGAYLDTGDFQILSSSPERFLKLTNNNVVTRPMKGTRPRGRNKNEDASLRRELLNSAKDKAELTMIVDLERNDLGKVCNYDSIRVNRLRELERYNTVYQTTATISGILHKNKDRIDLLSSCFPGGSITGCPKIRAMEIIEELEPHRRAIYTGSLGYCSFSGDLDFNILIRTILKKENTLYFGVGGAIVADSRPEAEYQETLIKAGAMLEAIK